MLLRPGHRERHFTRTPPGRWTSPSTWPPSPDCPRCPGRSRGGDRSSPTSPAKSPSPTNGVSGGSSVTDPETGEVVWNGTTRRRPTATERRYIQARQPVCVFPGCRMPARDSDLDHTSDYAKGGPTHPHNLGPLCRHHHRLKHEAGWKLEQPTPGHVHLDQPTRAHLPLTGPGALSYDPVCPAATLHSWSVVASAAMAACDCSSVSSWTRQNSFPNGSCITAQSIRGR